MRTFLLIVLFMILTGCATWDTLEPSEKVALGVSAGLIGAALIIRNGEQGTVNNCISTRSIQTGCISPGFVQ